MAGRSSAGVIDALAHDVKLRGFVRNNMIDAMPSRRSRRIQLLNEVAQVFEPGVRYPESEVNELLGAIYPDYASLRRYLVDEELMARAEGIYWRIGGPVGH